jgi:hypothetical protein
MTRRKLDWYILMKDKFKSPMKGGGLSTNYESNTRKTRVIIPLWGLDDQTKAGHSGCRLHKTHGTWKLIEFKNVHKSKVTHTQLLIQNCKTFARQGALKPDKIFQKVNTWTPQEVDAHKYLISVFCLMDPSFSDRKHWFISRIIVVIFAKTVAPLLARKQALKLVRVRWSDSVSVASPYFEGH